MARLFDDASSHYLNNASAAIAAYPWSFSCWMNSDSAADAQCLFSIGAIGNDNNDWSLFAQGTVAGDPIRFTSRAGGVNQTADTPTGYSTNTWHHIFAEAGSATDRKVYIDNGTAGTNTNSSTPASVDTTRFGARARATIASFFSGRLAEAGLWNVVLDAGERAALRAGISPLLIRRGSLVAYWPLIGRDSPEPDRKGGFAMTVNGATVGDHCRVLKSGVILVERTIVVAGGSRVPAFMHNYRRRRV